MSRIDRWLSAFFALAVIVEVSVRSDLPSRPMALAFGLLIALAISFRRNFPLGATVFAFGLAIGSTLLEIWLKLPDIAPVTSAAVLLMPYSLCRWGTRRQILLGAAVLVITWAVSLSSGEMARPGDAIGAAVVMLLPGVIGTAVRFRAEAEDRAVDQARLREREQLARELHDSVAHHVAAITLQAQAARMVMSSRPEDAKTALLAIEDEAKRTLAELRAIVGTLRDDTGAPVTPEGRIAELPSLAKRTGTPLIAVELVGELDGLPPAVERAIYRLAQESITNAIKHARNATTVRLRVAAEGEGIHLTAQDDGQSIVSRGAGFGLVGMKERTTLLGGTFAAGPSDGGGWKVDAVVPRKGIA